MTTAIHQGHVELGDAQFGATLRLEPGGVTLEVASTGGTPNMPGRLAILLFTSSTGYFAEELTWLGERVEELGRIVHIVCSERIAALDNTAREAV